jgi:hypothetical protein
MTVRSASAKSLAPLLAVIFATGAVTAEAARPRRGPSPEQVKKMKAELEYRQKEMLRVQQEIATKERELYLSFDENSNGKLEGAEQAKYNKQLHAIKTGKAPNPLSTITPPGQGPRDPDASKKK